MSTNQIFSSSSSTTFTSSSSINGQEHASGHRSAQQTYTDPLGNTTVKSASQNLGEPVTSSTQSFDSSGRALADAGSRRIEDVTDSEQAKRDAEYEERMEEEYAKREGGA